jgi:hypothetical protein
MTMRKHETEIPNAETRSAIAEAERGEATSFKTVSDLMASLNAEEGSDDEPIDRSQPP